jgi:hypothetical protein
MAGSFTLLQFQEVPDIAFSPLPASMEFLELLRMAVTPGDVPDVGASL